MMELVSTDAKPARVRVFEAASRKVVVVEDNPLNMKLFCDLLTAQGCRTIEVSRGDRAFKVIRDNLPDLVLMDIQLPHVSGIDITRALRRDARTRDIPVIAVTAFARKSEEDQMRASGCNAFLTKPISVAHFVRTVHSYLDG